MGCTSIMCLQSKRLVAVYTHVLLLHLKSILLASSCIQCRGNPVPLCQHYLLRAAALKPNESHLQYSTCSQACLCQLRSAPPWPITTRHVHSILHTVILLFFFFSRRCYNAKLLTTNAVPMHKQPMSRLVVRNIACCIACA